MNKRILIFAGVALVLISFSFIVFSWSSLASTQKSAKRGSARSSTQQQSGDAASNEPDTRRDVFIAANRAPQAPEIGEGTWLNSEPLKSENLRGRVVLVDFWTFGCYNCRNTLPTLKRLNARYSDKGLTIIGVHSPESDYEKNMDNVRREISKLG
jgi:thiol-disulfide isomerase/thioredoxin